MKKYAKNALIGLGIIFFYFLFSKIVLIILNYLNIRPASWSEVNQVIYLLFISIFMLFIIIFAYYKEIRKEFKDFRLNFKSYFNDYKKYWPIMIVLMTLSSVFISFFTPDIAQNEEVIRETLHRSVPYFIYTCISCSFIAPLMEELVFRKSIKKIVPKSYLFIVVSGLVFGSMHVIGQTSNIVDYLYILSYSVPGFVLAYTYDKSDNIFVSTSIHFFHNTILLIIQIIFIMGGILWQEEEKKNI